MPERPLVSIIIPSFNHGSEVVACLRSIAIQSYRPFEVIVVDDGSSDHTARRIQNTRTWFDLKMIELPHNEGASAARNRGADAANGELLLFVDADAELRPHMIERMHEELQVFPEVAFAYSSFRFGWKLFRSQSFDVDELRRQPYIHTTSLLRRVAFPRFDESLKKFQDWDLWLTIASKGGTGRYIPEELFALKVRHNGISRWLPSFVHQLPWDILGWMPREIRSYRKNERIIKQKHHIQ